MKLPACKNCDHYRQDCRAPCWVVEQYINNHGDGMQNIWNQFIYERSNPQEQKPDMNEFLGLCKKCRHYKTCTTPCYPVKQYLQDENRGNHEKVSYRKDGRGEIMILNTPNYYYGERLESNLSYDFDKNGRQDTRELDRAFSTENESIFAAINSDYLYANIFADRFFNRLSYDDLAIKYDVSKDNAVKYYHHAQKQLTKALKAMDENKTKPSALDANTIDTVRKIHSEKLMPVKEICRVFGIAKTTLYNYVRL